MRRILLALVLAMALSHAARGADNNATKQTESMQIRLKLEDRVLTATLIDSKTTGFHLPVAANADDERSVPQGEVRSSATSDTIRAR